MTPFLKSALVSCATASTLAVSMIASPALADTQLVLSSWLPSQHPLVVNAVRPWAENVAEVTEGRVTVRVLSSPLGPPPAHFDMAAEGVADITYGLHSFTSDDRFQRSRIGQFSFIGDTAVAASTAFWDVYSGTLDAQEEHEGVHLLGLFLHGPGMFHTNEQRISEPADFEGQKIRTPGGYIAELTRGLGAETLFMSPGEVFERLSRGVIDGVTFPAEALNAFRLTDHINYSMRLPGGLYNTSWFLVVNEGAWEGISEEDRAAIDAISGAAFAELAGQAWDNADIVGLELIDESGIELYDPSPAVLEAIQAQAAPLEEAWIEALSADGYDGAAALAELREQASQ